MPTLELRDVKHNVVLSSWQKDDQEKRTLASEIDSVSVQTDYERSTLILHKYTMTCHVHVHVRWHNIILKHHFIGGTPKAEVSGIGGI
jgi:hypothetical protein